MTEVLATSARSSEPGTAIHLRSAAFNVRSAGEKNAALVENAIPRAARAKLRK